MQTLGLSGSTPKTQGRIKSLFWPTIGNDYDVDYLTRQGFWLCTIVAAMTLVFSFVAGNGVAALLDVAFFFTCGIGIRVSSRTAAVCAFVAYLFTGIVMVKMGVQGFSILRIICLGLLLSNVRATFLAAQWVASRTEPPPAPLTGTFWERFSDVMPRKVWPIGQYFFYVLAALELFGLISALVLPRTTMFE
jgi:hypothetical protein